MVVVRKSICSKGSERRSLRVAFATLAIVTFCQGAACCIHAVTVLVVCVCSLLKNLQVLNKC
jgi:hypothetical protein